MTHNVMIKIPKLFRQLGDDRLEYVFDKVGAAVDKTTINLYELRSRI